MFILLSKFIKTKTPVENKFLHLGLKDSHAVIFTGFEETDLWESIRLSLILRVKTIFECRR